MAVKINLKIINLILLILILSGCNYTDLTGMFLTRESVNERFEESIVLNNEHGLQHLYITEENYNICAMSDAHIGGTKNYDSFQSLSLLMNAIAVVYVGDMCNGNVEDYDTLTKHMLNTDTLKAFTIVGNHDIYFGGWNEYLKRFGSSTYYFDVNTPTGKDLFICLDSGSGTLGDLQLVWLKDVLKNIRPSYRHCVIFSHNHLYKPRKNVITNINNDELAVLTDYFLRYRVDMTIAGHDHYRDVLKLGNTTHIIIGPLADSYANAGFVKLNVSDSIVTYSFFSK